VFRPSHRRAVVAASVVLALSSMTPVALASRSGGDPDPEPGGGQLPELGLPELGLPELGVPGLGVPPLPELGGLPGLPTLPGLPGLPTLPGLPGNPVVGLDLSALITLTLSGSISVL
jgi:hypothetical protein